MRKLYVYVLAMLAFISPISIVSADTTSLSTVMVLDFELLGDTSVESMKQEDARLMMKFSHELKMKLHEQQIFNVLKDKHSVSMIEQAAQKQFLHRCNGCELELAKKLGATQVVIPWVFRMSKLVQTMYLEIRDVESGKVVMHKGRNFRGNTDNGWQHVTAQLINETKIWSQK